MTTTNCACCEAYGFETPATTTAPAIVNEDGEFVRTGEELPSCSSCRAETLDALGMLAPARRAFDLRVLETKGDWSQVTDDVAHFWVPTAALDEDVEAGLTGEALGDQYADWCREAPTCEECPE